MPPKLTKPVERDTCDNRKDTTYKLVGKITTKDKRSSSTTSKCEKCGKQGIWFIKYNKDSLNQRIYFELIAQEFFRLIIGNTQPKTRMVRFTNNPNPKQCYLITSKEVPKFCSLANIFLKKDFNKIKINNLGPILITAIFLLEIDLKLENIGIDKDNNLVKIDGDCCFAGLIDEKYSNYMPITQGILNDPLINRNYKGQAFNWLNIVGNESHSNRQYNFWKEQISPNEQNFKNSTYETILLVLSLPNNLFENFLSHYKFGVLMDESVNISKEIKRYLINRASQLKQEALLILKFRSYIDTKKAKEKLAENLERIVNFVPKRHEKLFENNREKQNFIEDATENLDALIKLSEKYVIGSMGI